MAEKKPERKKQVKKKPPAKRPTKRAPKKTAKKKPERNVPKRGHVQQTSRQETVTPRPATAEEQEQVRQDRETAKEYARDKKKTGMLLQGAMEKAERKRGVLQKVWDDLMTLFRLVGAWVGGTYTALPWETIVWIIAAIIYFVNPFDVIPDFIPGLGYLDDAAVIAFVANSVRGDIEDFRAWEKSQA